MTGVRDKVIKCTLEIEASKVNPFPGAWLGFSSTRFVDLNGSSWDKPR